MMAGTGPRVAVLIDGDNVSARVIAGVMTAVAQYGTVSVRRIYGDWTSPQMRSWKECLLEHSVQPIQQFAYTSGKNATDGAMIIDAMDLMYTGRFSSFCIVSSDSDFVRLAVRIREQGIAVYGFGERRTTHKALVNACNEFVYFDALQMSDVAIRDADGAVPEPLMSTAAQSASTQHPNPPTGPRAMIPTSLPIRSEPRQALPVVRQQRQLESTALGIIRRAIIDCKTYEDDYVNLADLGDILPRMSADLTARNYGYERFKPFIEASGIVETKMKLMGNAPPVALVRLKDS